VGNPKRRNSTRRLSTPEVLAASLPDDLRRFDELHTPEDLRSLWTAVADYLNTQVPGQGDSLVLPVLAVAGFHVAGWYRGALHHRPARGLS
jgi:hypothetical protein